MLTKAPWVTRSGLLLLLSEASCSGGASANSPSVDAGGSTSASGGSAGTANTGGSGNRAGSSSSAGAGTGGQAGAGPVGSSRVVGYLPNWNGSYVDWIGQVPFGEL